MIDEKSLQEAIAECKGQRNPTASTCIKLASYYTILNNLEPKENVYVQSYSRNAESIDYNSDTEFMESIQGKDLYEVWKLIDELMTTIQVLNPKLYDSVIRHIEDL